MAKRKPRFKKNDSGKLRWHLFHWPSLERILEVLEHGVDEYGEDNWKECDDENRYLNALQRHISARFQGEIRDPKTGLSHLAHAGCCIIFLLFMEEENEL